MPAHKHPTWPSGYTRLDMYGRLAILLTVLIVGLAPASAHASSQENISSTHTALVAAYVALHGVVDSWPTLEASLHKLDLRFATECPDVGAGSPQSESEQRLSYAVAGALWATGYHTDSKIAQAFIRVVNPLRWSNPSITRSAHKFIVGLREMTSLSVPDLCGDVRSWNASGYQTIPASTLQYDQHVEAIDVEVPSLKLIAPYVRPADRGLFARVKRLLVRFEELEFVTGQRYWDTLLETLGLNQ
jgi:hypothetical protein